jgi:hypothetical protein
VLEQQSCRNILPVEVISPVTEGIGTAGTSETMEPEGMGTAGTRLVAGGAWI